MFKMIFVIVAIVSNVIIYGCIIVAEIYTYFNNKKRHKLNELVKKI